jgi:hypothetical protein
VPHYTALEKGWYKDEGLDVNILKTPGTGQHGSDHQALREARRAAEKREEEEGRRDDLLELEAITIDPRDPSTVYVGTSVGVVKGTLTIGGTAA